MKKAVFLIVWTILTNLSYGQNNEGLNSLKFLDHEYKDYTISYLKQIPEDIAVRFIGELKYFTNCINGRVAVLPVSENKTKSSKLLLQNHFNKKLNFTINPQSKWKFIIFIENSTGFETSSTLVLNVGYCANETELKNGGGVYWGDCSDIKPLAKGSIFLVNTNERVLLFNDVIQVSNDNMESLMKEYASIAANKLLLYVQSENDKKLIDAVIKEDLMELNNILSNSKPNINTIVYDHGWTPLIISASKGNIDLVKILLDNGANVNASLSNDFSSLHFAAQKENLEMLKLLIKYNAIIDNQTSDGKTPLWIATSKNSLEIVKYLVSKGASINLKTNDGITALMTAVRYGNYEIVKYLVDNGARIDEKDNDGLSALIMSIDIKNSEIFKFLIDNNAIIDNQANNGLTPLMVASYKNNLGNVKLLVSKGANINLKTNDGNTALMFAVHYGNYEIVKYLVDNGARIDEKNNNGKNALMIAQEKKFTEIIEILKK